MSWYDVLVPRIKRRRKREKGVPEGVWTKCQECGNPVTEDEMAAALGVCPKCGFHHHLDPVARAQALFDPQATITEIGGNIRPRDFLDFTASVRYADRLAALDGDGRNEALRVHHGMLGGRPAVAACFDFRFMGGSMGSVVGERFARGIDHACDHDAPFITFAASGGARMQEGLVSLMQMAKTTAALARLAGKGRALPHVSVLCNPTTGGVAASFALVGDIIIAETGALVGFAGPRVIEATVRTKLPAGFQRAEFLLEHGSVDMVVPRGELRTVILDLVGMIHDAPAG